MPFKNREDYLAYQKRYAETHKKEKREYYDANIDKIRAYGREYNRRKKREKDEGVQG